MVKHVGQDVLVGCPLGPSIAAVWRLREPRSRALSRLGSLKDIVQARRIPAALGQPSLRRLQDGQPPRRPDADFRDRKGVGEGKSVSVRVDIGGRSINKKKKTT